MLYKLTFADKSGSNIQHFKKCTTDVNKLSLYIAEYPVSEKEAMKAGCMPNKFLIVSAYKNKYATEPTETQIFYKL